MKTQTFTLKNGTIVERGTCPVCFQTVSKTTPPKRNQMLNKKES